MVPIKPLEFLRRPMVFSKVSVFEAFFYSLGDSYFCFQRV